jgi:hypothetical protein
MNQLHHMRDERSAQRSKATQSITPNFHVLSPLEVCVNSSTLPCALQSSHARRLADHRLSLSRHEGLCCVLPDVDEGSKCIISNRVNLVIESYLLVSNGVGLALQSADVRWSSRCARPVKDFPTFF